MAPKDELEHREAATRPVNVDRQPAEAPALPEPDLSDLLVSDDLIEDISIDGMCGVY
jgi:mycofactocin precursor